jgi:hypothetical protein
MALFLEEVHLCGLEFADFDAENGEKLAFGAIAAGFHFLGIRQTTFIDVHNGDMIA